jgi:Ca2+-binding EF-hand superfamily protein
MEKTMRTLLIAVSAAALTGFALPACAQNADAGGRHHGPADMLFQADANHDGVVTRAEFDAARTAHFAQMDANHDGVLTRDEMWRGGPGGQHGRHRGAGMRLMHADADHNGIITKEEFLARPTAEFDRLDTNHDGTLSGAELPQGGPPEGERRAGGPPGGEHGPGHGWADPDANHDGRITQAEFAAAGTSLFDRLDANHDGRITREEAEAGHPPRPPQGN